MSADSSAVVGSAIGVIVPLAALGVAYKIVDNTMRGSYDRPQRKSSRRMSRSSSIWNMY